LYFFFLRYATPFLVRDPSRSSFTSPLVVSFLLGLCHWLFVCVYMSCYNGVVMLILLRSLCTEENIYSKSPYIPRQAFCTIMYVRT